MQFISNLLYVTRKVVKMGLVIYHTWWCRCSILLGRISSHGKLLKLFSTGGGGGCIPAAKSCCCCCCCLWLSRLFSCLAALSFRTSISFWSRATSWKGTGLGWALPWEWSHNSGWNLKAVGVKIQSTMWVLRPAHPVTGVEVAIRSCH